MKKIPTLIVVRKNLSKARHQYFTFLGQEGCEYLRDYLESRMRKGETLNGDSPPINPKVAKNNLFQHIEGATLFGHSISSRLGEIYLSV